MPMLAMREHRWSSTTVLDMMFSSVVLWKCLPACLQLCARGPNAMLVAAASSGAVWGGQLRARHVLTRSSHAGVGPYTVVRLILDSAVALHPFHPPRSLTWVPGEHGSPRAKPTPLRVRRRSAARGCRGAPEGVAKPSGT